MVVAGAAAIFATPLVVTTATIFPFELGSALASRTLIELLLPTWLLTTLLRADSVRCPSRIVVGLALLLATGMVAGLSGVDPVRSFWSSYARAGGEWAALHWFAFVVILASLGPDERTWRAMLWAYVGVGAVLGTIAVLEAHSAWPLAASRGDARVVATVGNPSQLGALLAAALILACGRIASDVPLRGAWLGMLAIPLLLGWALVLTGSRGPALGVLCGLGIFVFLSRGSRGPRLIVRVLGTAVALLAIWFFVAPGGLALGARGMWRFTGLAERFELWRVAGHGLLDRVALGWGPGNYALVFDRYAGSPAPVGGWANVDSPHNAIVELGVETGLVGLLALLALIVVVIQRIVSDGRSIPWPAERAAVAGALVATAAHAMVAPHAGTTSLTLVLLVGWLAAHEPARVCSRPISIPTRAKMAGWAVVTGLVGVAAAAVVGVHVPMYRAAANARRALGAPVGSARWYAAARRSIAVYPPRSPYVRTLIFGQVASELAALSGPRLKLARSFVRHRGFESLDRYPDDGRLYHAVLGVLQAEASDAGALHQLDPYLERLARIAPARAGTSQLLAIQALRRGDCNTAREIIGDYRTRVPEAAPAFAPLVRMVEALGSSGCDRRPARRDSLGR